MYERPRYGLSAEDCDILNEEYRAEQAAADEEAALAYRLMLEEDDSRWRVQYGGTDAETFTPWTFPRETP